jgi:hypothetical protein
VLGGLDAVDEAGEAVSLAKLRGQGATAKARAELVRH